MKRMIIALVVLALVGAFAFADGPAVAWKAWTYSGFGIVSTTSATTIAPYDYTWEGTGAVRLLMTDTSADGNAGFNSRLQMSYPFTSSQTAAFNQLNGWAKMFNGMFTVRAGINDDYTIATPIWNNYGTTDGKVGIYFDISPLAGLDIGYFQPIPTAASPIANLMAPTGSGHAILGLAYNMANIGKVELGYVAATPAQYYFGAAITAVKGLTAQLEGYVDANGGVVALENVAYAMGAFTVGSYIGESVSGSTFNWGLEPTASYKLTSAFSLNAIANVYSTPVGMTWMSPIDAGMFGAAATTTAPITPATGLFVTPTTGFGAGVSLSYTVSGSTVSFGDYYASGTGGGNIFYVNADLAL
jgi:hypothetical protein